MTEEVVFDLLYCFVIVGIFLIPICVLDFIAEHIIPERIMDKIMKAIFGEVPEEFDE